MDFLEPNNPINKHASRKFFSYFSSYLHADEPGGIALAGRAQ